MNDIDIDAIQIKTGFVHENTPNLNVSNMGLNNHVVNNNNYDQNSQKMEKIEIEDKKHEHDSNNNRVIINNCIHEIKYNCYTALMVYFSILFFALSCIGWFGCSLSSAEYCENDYKLITINQNQNCERLVCCPHNQDISNMTNCQWDPPKKICSNFSTWQWMTISSIVNLIVILFFLFCKHKYQY
jgi:hypothetical protein